MDSITKQASPSDEDLYELLFADEQTPPYKKGKGLDKEIETRIQRGK